MNQVEVRTLKINELESRSKENSNNISGYAVVYDTYTEIRDAWGDTFHERIDPDAMVKTLQNGHDIFALRNHDYNQIVGRSGVNLTLENHENGLYFDLTAPNTTLGRDLLEEVRTGLIKGCSFGFRVNEDEWTERDGEYFRTIKDVELREITLTPIPAYSETSAEVRSLNLKVDKTDEPMDTYAEERKQILADAQEVLNRLKK